MATATKQQLRYRLTVMPDPAQPSKLIRLFFDTEAMRNRAKVKADAAGFLTEVATVLVEVE